MIHKDRTCCFTGPRELPEGEIPEIKARLAKEIDRLLRQGINGFLCGGEPGFDLLAAAEVINRKNENPDVKLLLYLPFPASGKSRGENEALCHRFIFERADSVIALSERYSPGCSFLRSRRMADDSRYCVAYLKEPVGGAAYTVRYAERHGLTVVNLAGSTGGMKGGETL